MREDNILGRNKTRLALWEEHLKDPIVALDGALKVLALALCGGSVLQWLVLASSKVCTKSRSGRAGVCPYLDPINIVCLNVPGKYGPHSELFFFLMQKEPATVPGSETFSNFINADIRTPLLLC